MIIKNITINNFRSYYKSNSFDFTDGLTLIIGDNGDGKTTFFEALQWLFNTSVENKSIEHFSEMRKEEIEIGEKDKVSVSIEFEHDGNKLVEKSFVVEKVDEKEFNIGNFSFIGYETDGSERIRIEGKRLIERCFDAFIQRYSMFKGESNLNVFDDKDALKMLVDKLSDIHEFDEYEKMTASFEEKSNKAYEKECKNDVKTKKEAEKLDTEKQSVLNQLSNIRSDIRDMEKTVNLFASKIENLEKNKEASERYQEIKGILASRNEKVKELTARINRENLNFNLLDKLWILAPFPSILTAYKKKISAFSKEKRKQHENFIREQGAQEERKKVINEINSFANGVAKLPWYLPNQETMQEMIDDEICKVCGRPATKGTEAYDFMVQKLNEYRKNIETKLETENKKNINKELFINKYIDELSNISILLSGETEKEIVQKAFEIKEKLELLERLKVDLEEAKSKVQETEDDKARLLIHVDDLTEDQLDIQFSDLKGYFDQRGKAEKRRMELKQKEEQLSLELKELEDKFRDLDPATGMAKIYQHVHNVLMHIANAFKDAKARNLKVFLDDLEKLANSYMDRLNENDFYGRIRLRRTADESVRIVLMSDNNTEIKNPGGAQRTTMYMSVLFAISDLTSTKREENYPLIFDAPTSSFGSIKEDVFYNIIDKIEKQCIIVTKDLLIDGNLNYSKINLLTCSVYRIRKGEGFNKNDLSTICTKIEKIK